MLSVEKYLDEVSESLEGSDSDIMQAAYYVINAKKNGNSLWVLGNGGSLAIAQHFAQDLIKMAGVKAHAMNCPSIITAYSNDHSFEYAFFAPIEVLRRKGDAFMIFSCSGKSRNYIEFFSQGVKPIISVVGTDGGFLAEKSDVCVKVKSDDYQICETAFCVVADIILKTVLDLTGED